MAINLPQNHSKKAIQFALDKRSGKFVMLSSGRPCRIITNKKLEDERNPPRNKK